VRVLVVDDNPDALRTLGALLTLEQHTVALATNARLALEAASTRPFDVVLVDILMPGMDGYEIASKIRALTLDKQPVIIAMSGRKAPNEAEIKRWGIDAYMQKPVDMDALLAAVKGAGAT
jgi:DNA-binding response OmpR family regulator